jgi:hypothetical protein
MILPLTSDSYYMNLCSLVLRKEPFSTFMELYGRLVPHSWSPGREFFIRLLDEVKNRGAVQYLGKVNVHCTASWGPSKAFLMRSII